MLERHVRQLEKGQGEDPAYAELINDVKAELNRQARRLIDLGFHKELGLSEKEYLTSLPKPKTQPEALKGWLDILVLVDPRIPVAQQCKLAGVAYLLGGLNVREWPLDPKGYKTPRIPYLTWLQDGTENLNKNVQTVRRGLKPDERGGTEFDGIGLYLAHPDVLRHHSLDFPGTVVESVHAPDLGLWHGALELNGHWVGGANPHCGSVSCGRQ